MKKSSNFRSKKDYLAFSLVELSVVIIIIGILIAGVTQGARLIDETRLKTARALTTNSRINSMEGLVLWYETSLVSSFSKTNAVDGAVVSQWNDNNPQTAIKLHAYAGQKTDATKNSYNSSAGGTSSNTRGPTYFEDGINHIPTLNFVQSAAPSFQYLVTDRQMNNNPRDSMTLFYVMRYNGGGGYFIDRACYSDALGASKCSDFGRYGVFGHHTGTGNLNFVLRDDNFVAFPSCSGIFCATGYNFVPGQSYIITLQRDYGVSFVTYINGSSSYSSNSTKADNGEPLSVDPFKIGSHDYINSNTLNMDMSEIIFFSGAIKKRDRDEIENYLGKKYNIAVSH